MLFQLKKRSRTIPSSEITPEHIYLSRRQFMAGAAVLTASTALAACAAPSTEVVETAVPPTLAPGAPTAAPPQSQATADELGAPLTDYDTITTYNNYYEFSIDKGEVAPLAQGFRTNPWQIEVGGMVNKPGIYDMDDLRGKFDQEERIYRLRCVEAWSMVIPWNGFSLAKLLAEVEPTAEARYVRFETLLDPEQMPGQKSRWYSWPYVEGLRLDEAMHDLTLLATGLYGRDLAPQNGAPIRLVVPWKYGFKSIKSIVKIELTNVMPTSLWMDAAPNEYGFYANVNPEVSHPRWSQSTERRIGEFSRRETLKFNGYEEEVAHLYADMDLRKHF
ncbi:MAG: protein-methionine-sulfoxide reductase catalytic subunit MsrP [Chloroflexi bacterium]|nr:protein-methionine-sulfoxide reductase catalytic subunit MsrP [Chloroflexota bacterium]